MKRISTWFTCGAEGVAAAMLAAMFFTFLLQIFSRYVLVTPFGWTLELCLILWVWIVFFGNAFIVHEKDHVTFDILYLAMPRRGQKTLALIAAASIVAGMAWSFLPTWDYIDWMKIRKTTTVENPLTGKKIPLRTIFSIYLIFMIAIIIRYSWRFIDILRHGPPSGEHDIPGHDHEPPSIQHGDEAV
ncbi:TRAP transporter small permease [Labrenzia sp. PHM005]|jgi:C4-dicarboxylate transporter DctQ subunit|uniref:TRAP transporter small permease n=1 Tax=Stappiaceae TaxID=2821832 RepID=UPI00113FE0EA|nr:TRAP transporter small permease subunit [Labrenzia sp. PHM005]QDG78487.1 TRAP transporter small permease [Labrenzia sp. PHM005]